MHSMMFVVTIPDEAGKWGGFLAYARQIPLSKDVARLAENVWLVNMREAPQALALLVYRADAETMTYGILPFADAPQWLPGGFDPSTIRGRSGPP